MGKRDAEPMVSITASGMLSINAAATEQWLSKAKAVQLLFDPEKRLVGIKPVSPDTANGLKLRRPARAAGTQVSAQGFLDHYKIKADKAKRFPAEWNAEVGAVLFALGK